MNIKKFAEHIGDLVGKDDLNKAIELLSQLLKNSPLLDEVIMQNSQLSDLTKQIRNGLITSEGASMYKNKIRMAILSLASEIEEKVNNNEDLQNEILNHVEPPYKYSVIQNHSGSGDNIHGDKNIYM